MDTDNKKETKIPAVRTFRSDLDQAVHDQGASLASIMLAEKKHQEETSKVVAAKSIKSSLIYVLLSILLIVGAVVSYFVFKSMTDKASTAQVVQDQLSTYVSYDTVTHLKADGLIGKESIGAVVQSARSQAGKNGSIEVLSFEKNAPAVTLTTSEFFKALMVNPSANLLNSVSENLMTGIYTTPNLDRHLFLIFGVQNYDKALTGALEWERTIINDLFTIFNIQVSGNYSPILNSQFEDVVINNKNARIIRDVNGKPALYMLFINKDLFIITDNEDAIQEITNRSLVKNAKPL